MCMCVCVCVCVCVYVCVVSEREGREREKQHHSGCFVFNGYLFSRRKTIRRNDTCIRVHSTTGSKVDSSKMAALNDDRRRVPKRARSCDAISVSRPSRRACATCNARVRVIDAPPCHGRWSNFFRDASGSVPVHTVPP